MLNALCAGGIGAYMIITLGNACLLGAGQGISIIVGGNDRNDLSTHQLPPVLGVDQRLQVGAAAGNQYGDPFTHFSTTFSSPATI